MDNIARYSEQPRGQNHLAMQVNKTLVIKGYKQK